jgi:hypothetical protein
MSTLRPGLLPWYTELDEYWRTIAAMRRFTITGIIEGNGQPHPTFTRDAAYPVLEVLWQPSGNLPGFLVADDQGRFHFIRMDHCRLSKIEAL